MALSITPDAVWEALRQVDDPDLKRDIVTLGMVKDVGVKGADVFFTVELTTPACPMKEAIHNACVTAVHTLVSPSAQVHVTMTARVTASQRPGVAPLPGVQNMIAVASGKGGVGKSTVAANLAVALAQTGASVGLLDADIYGPSVPILFGLEDAQPEVVTQDGKNLMMPLAKHGIWLMSIGFLVEKGKSIVWRGPMASNAFKQLAGDTRWPPLDYLVVDLPPGTGDIHITLAQQFPLTAALVVTTPQPVAVADARKALGMFVSPPLQVPVLGVVENMAYFSPPARPDERYYLFGQGGGQALADEFGLPLLEQIPLVEAFRQASDDGAPSALHKEHPLYGVWLGLAQRVAQQLSVLNAQHS